jgi:EAL domain-containing protein (putative c-di-GMP-specific phosphodiesterase class I)
MPTVENDRHSTQDLRAVAPTYEIGQKAVLLVDDDDKLAAGLRRILIKEGYQVTLANNGAAAAEIITQQSFDVILSDIQMPGMSGVDLLSVVRAYDLDVPVILMTGDPTLQTAIDAVSLGALQYLVKPTKIDVLLAAVAKASQLSRMVRMKREAFRLLDEEGTRAGTRAGLAESFNRALDTMWMAFQPIVDTRTRRVFAYEALMRTREPSLPHPGAVLDAAEKLERLPDLGRRVRALSVEAFAKAPADVLLFVNLHTRDLLDPELYTADSPLMKMASRVVLEITERSTIDAVKDIQGRVEVLRFHGFRMAIDDLGAGYAGLSSFIALQPEFVKLDMSLVRNVDESAVRQQLVGSMAALCKEMKITVVAEGIETDGERASVQMLGCDLLQGYFFAKPGPPFPTTHGLD